MSELEDPSWLKQLNLFCVHGRLLRADLFKIWKIFNSEIDVGLEIILEIHSGFIRSGKVRNSQDLGVSKSEETTIV